MPVAQLSLPRTGIRYWDFGKRVFVMREAPATHCTRRRPLQRIVSALRRSIPMRGAARPPSHHANARLVKFYFQQRRGPT
jgi:hypothetical protein